MTTKSRAAKAPKLFIKTGKEAANIRIKLGINQTAFWRRVAVTQSGGSRYESGRSIPRSVQLLLHLAYAPEAVAQEMFLFLRAE